MTADIQIAAILIATMVGSHKAVAAPGRMRLDYGE
jgi:hypothetical protein